MSDTYAIMAGGPQSGFTFVGPFDFSAEAIEHADEEFTSEAWWVITLNTPEETEEAAQERIDRMASALATSEGYDPNDMSVAEWNEAKSRYENRARKVLDVLAAEDGIEHEDGDDELEQPDEEDED